jgi:hypothetical protein
MLSILSKILVTFFFILLCPLITFILIDMWRVPAIIILAVLVVATAVCLIRQWKREEAYLGIWGRINTKRLRELLHIIDLLMIASMSEAEAGPYVIKNDPVARKLKKRGVFDTFCRAVARARSVGIVEGFTGGGVSTYGGRAETKKFYSLVIFYEGGEFLDLGYFKKDREAEKAGRSLAERMKIPLEVKI